MDFIKRLFGLAPDSGGGSTGIVWLVVVVIALAGVAYFRMRRRKARQISRRPPR